MEAMVVERPMGPVQRAKRAMSTSLYPRHEAMLDAIRLKRGAAHPRRSIPDRSSVVQEAIEALAEREFDAASYAALVELPGGVDDDGF